LRSVRTNATALSNEDLLAGLLTRQPEVVARFFDLHGARVRGLIYHILGPDDEIEDLVHETFIRAIESASRVRDADATDRWIAGIAVLTARIRLQSRRRRWWLRVLPWDQVPEVDTPPPNVEAREALQSLKLVLRQLPAEERIAVVLRRVEGMKLDDAAAVAGASLATFKRRLARGERRLEELARRFEALAPWLAKGDVE
jgi:RNA polymerase sigma-70 factor (ECF subfamily)